MSWIVPVGGISLVILLLAGQTIRTWDLSNEVQVLRDHLAHSQGQTDAALKVADRWRANSDAFEKTSDSFQKTNAKNEELVQGLLKSLREVTASCGARP